MNLVPRIRIRNRFVRWLFKRIYRRWFEDADEIIEVRGWRTALVDHSWNGHPRAGGRGTVTPCFWWFK